MAGLLVTESHAAHHFFPMVGGKLAVAFIDDGKGILAPRRMVVGVGQLEAQTLLQRARSDTPRLEGLEEANESLHLGHIGIDVVIDGQFVGNRQGVLAQETIAIERTDEVVHDLALVLGEVVLADLSLQFLVERTLVGHHVFTTCFGAFGSLAEVVGHLVFGGVVAQCLGDVAGNAVLHSLIVSTLGIVGGRVGGIKSRIVFVVGLFKCLIVNHLVLHAFGKLRQWQFHHLRECHLCQRELLHLRGSLYKDVFLSHKR